MGSAHRAQTFHFWCLILVSGGLSSGLPSLLPVGPVPSVLLGVQLPGHAGSTAWPGALPATLGTALGPGSPESARLPLAPPRHRSPVLQPIPGAPWGQLRPGLKRHCESSSPFLSCPWPQDHRPAPPERGRLCLGFPERHLPLLPNWSCSKLSEDFRKSGMCIFPGGSP